MQKERTYTLDGPISGGRLVSGIISLLANRRVYIGGGFNVVFYGMTVFKFLPYPFEVVQHPFVVVLGRGLLDKPKP